MAREILGTITVVGEGGAEFDLDVHASGTQRELLDYALAKGRLKLVDDPDGVLSASEEAPADESDTEPSGAGPPAKSANKPEWVAYAITQGADPDEAGAATKDQLVETYGGEG